MPLRTKYELRCWRDCDGRQASGSISSVVCPRAEEFGRAIETDLSNRFFNEMNSFSRQKVVPCVHEPEESSRHSASKVEKTSSRMMPSFRGGRKLFKNEVASISGIT